MDAAPISLAAYAQHRGISKQAVSKAIAKGRLTASVARDASGKLLGIADAAAADREWEASTDLSRASVSMKERAPRAEPPTPPPPSSPPPAEPLEAEGTTRIGMGLAAATEAEKVWKARLAELDYRERSGELVSAADMRAQIADSFAKVRARLLGIPTRAKQQLPHLTVVDTGTLDSLVREALEELVVELVTEGEAPGA